MGSGFDAGSILVSLKANLDNFNAGIASAKDTLKSLAGGASETVVEFKELNTAVVVFKEIETSSSRLKGVFNDLETGTQRLGQSFQTTTKNTDQTEQAFGRANVTWARSINRLISVQIALASLASGPGGPNQLKEAFQSLSNGVQTAAAAFQIAQGNLSLFSAGVIGIAVAAISVFSRHLEDMIKLTDAVTDEQIKSQAAINAYSHALVDAAEKASVFKNTLSQGLVAELSVMESAFTKNQQKLRELPQDIAKVRKEIGKAINVPISDEELAHITDPLMRQQLVNRGGNFNYDELQKLSEKLQALLNLQQRLSLQQQTIATTAPWKEANAAVVQLNEALKNTRFALAEIQERGRLAVSLGVEEPLQATTDNLNAAKKVFDELILDNDKIRQIAFSGKVPTDQIEQFLKEKLHSDSDIGEAASKLKSLIKEKKTEEAVNDLANTFSTSVGDGLRDAILNAKKPMEALASLGQNLFGNMIDQSVKRLETGLTEAFKSITGAGGEAIGLGITGILGAAGAVLSRLGSKSSSSFNPVQSAVTSTQAFRGVVAGQSSVAIADVGDNLSRALAPMFEKQDATNGWLSKIESNTRRSGGGPGGFPAVAAPTA